MLAPTKLKGVNIVSAPGQPGYDGSWSTMWQHWPWASIKAQIDMCRAIGANSVRGPIGGVGAIYDGSLSLQVYLDRQCQVAAYCQSIGMYYEPVGCAFEDLNGAPQATVVGYVKAIVQALTRYSSNVVSIDLSNEVIGGGYDLGIGSVGNDSKIIAYAAALYQACKPVAGKIPLSFSHSYPVNDYRVAELAPYSDALLFHLYPANMPSLSAVNTMLATYPSKAFAVTEFGASLYDTNRSAAYQEIEQIHALAACSGSMQWAAVDQQQAPYTWLQYGMFPTTESMSPRQDIYGVWKLFS